MSDFSDIPIEELTQDQFRGLRDAAKAGTQSQAELRAAQRELAFVRAGVDTDTPMGKVLFGSYQGELTKEAITTWVKELGIPQAAPNLPAETASEVIQASTTPPAPQSMFTDEERRAAQAAQSLFSGATSPVMPSGPADPHNEGLAAYRRARASGMEPVDAGAAYMDVLLKAVAANPGDRRVVWDGFTQQEMDEKRVPWG